LAAQRIISLPVQIAVYPSLRKGVPVVVIGSQASLTGLYRAPVVPVEQNPPPQTIISLPVQTTVWCAVAQGEPTFEVDVQTSVAGLYRAPVFSGTS
jgi:hypothetical protein